MISLYYLILFVISFILTIIYIIMWHKHLDITFTLVFALIPISCLGYVFLSNSNSLGEALIANKIIYIAIFLQYFIMLSVINICNINFSKLVKIFLFLCALALYGLVLSIGFSPIYYKDVTFDIVNGSGRLYKEYGVMHIYNYVYLIALLVISIVAIIYSFFKKRQVSRRILFLVLLPDVVSIFSYIIGRRIIDDFDLIPIGYVLAQFLYLLIVYRVSLYNINETVIDSIAQNGETGFISFDFKRRYLGSNETAKKIIPSLNGITVDETLIGDSIAGRKIKHWIDSFYEDEKNNSFVYVIHGDNATDERIYNVSVSYLYDGFRKRGFIINMIDDTQNRKYIELLDNYNEDLVKQVDAKTKHIVEMHDNLILSLATMVESRDNSTGGHIKRTSEGVRILIDEIIKNNDFNLSPEFCEDIIKAAPMHDLGKIAVDDAVLRKPGRFTEEEYAKMKKHAAEGARVIHDILKNTDDESFKLIAENVAHYHHERWDGSGYPEGLKGEDIPLEARIMAIADVYDALVSKRVYKDSMSFEQADSIIMEGMGSQFDPSLEKYYVNARPRLEEYYSNL